jgi:hypothetical protein
MNNAAPNSSPQRSNTEELHAFLVPSISQSLTVGSLASKSMRLKLGPREVSERRQVGDAEELLSSDKDDTKDAWWRNVGMEEGM